MESIKASEFKAKCLQLMDQVARTGTELTITKNGVAVAKLVPVRPRKASLLGRHAGAMDLSGDVESPVDATWEASA